VKPRAYRVHRTPGRIRFKIPGRRGDRAFFDEIAELLRRFSTVTKVDCNPLTGSLLLHHLGDIDGEPMQPLLSVLADVLEVDQSIQRYTRGALDLSTATALSLLALAGFQLLRGHQPVIAVSLAWYATELLRRWQDPSDKSGDPAEQPSSH
jgi:Heavy metal associated domain 2